LQKNFVFRQATIALSMRIFRIVHRKTATSIHAAPYRTATSVWSVGFNFVNQDASRSNELREAKWKEKGILSLITIPASARKVTKLNGKERSLCFEKELQHMTFHFNGSK